MNLTTHELRQFIVSRPVIILLIGAVILLAASNPSLFASIPRYSSRAFYWGFSIALYLLALPYWARLSYAVWRRFFDAPIPLILGSSPLVILLTLIAADLPQVIGNLAPPRGDPIEFTSFVRNCLIAHVLESIALLWLLPLYRTGQTADEPRQGHATEEDAPEFVVLSGRSLPIRSLRFVKSAEHYLIVTMDRGTIEIRARMKDFVEQLSDNCGIQTHRSFWVSANEATAFQGGAVKTRAGEDIPVSRGRLPTVRDWFHRQGKPH
ncbi:MAG: LytTR family DNA-binding domain-containing protein [Paracoccaceae bacterium]